MTKDTHANEAAAKAAEAEAATKAAEAEAAAKAAEADAAAKAAEAEAAAQKKPRRKAAKPDLAALSYAERQITMLNVTGHRLGLVDELRDHYGLKTPVDEETGQVQAEMLGIATDPAPDLGTALDNWGNAARRAIAEASA